MKDKVFDVVVVGGGFAGLSASYYLKKQGLDHIVFERGKIAESWRSQRWDSFRLNSTNKLNVLPGVNCDPVNEDVFWSAPEFVASMEQYVTANQLPVAENSKVISIEKPDQYFHVAVISNDGQEIYLSRQVVIASGVSNEIKIPSIANKISKDIKQLHSSEYRNADQLPPGVVLVVGGAQSGIQIAADLANAGRKVFFSTSKVARLPRWYRGRDIFYWLMDLKFFDMKAEEIEDPAIFEMKPPHISAGIGKNTLSLQSLAKKGVVILSKMEHASEENVFFQSNAADHIKFADDSSLKIKSMIDEYIETNNLDSPAPHNDEADIPDVNGVCASSETILAIKQNNITSIIWSTGFTADFKYLKLDVFDDNGKLKHKDGTTAIPGLYFLGYPWQLSRKSSIIFGIKEDAKVIIDSINNYSKSSFQTAQSCWNFDMDQHQV